MEQPPATRMDFDADSIMTEKGNTAQPQKAVQIQAPPSITYLNQTQELRMEKNPAQRLKTEQEATQKTQEETWGANDWDRIDWWGNYMGWGHPMFWGSNMPAPQTKGNYTKGGKVATNMAKPKGGSWREGIF